MRLFKLYRIWDTKHCYDYAKKPSNKLTRIEHCCLRSLKQSLKLLVFAVQLLGNQVRKAATSFTCGGPLRNVLYTKVRQEQTGLRYDSLRFLRRSTARLYRHVEHR
jgi:hypothetical protein